jgi:type IV pilus assembly protein PilB
LIAGAIEARASDIHVEPLADCLRVRYRIDGVMSDYERLPLEVQAGVASRIKILGRLNIAERRIPQDGRTKFIFGGHPIDLRISTAPLMHGESIVLRILDREAVSLDFSTLGFDRAAEDILHKLLSAPNGIILVTGPTGSGKTTTLYTALKTLNSAERKIFSVEDPIEYQLPGVNQMQIKPNIGLDFVQCLRSILRQDPDVIMIGEMRDVETARIGIQASLTGHLVLSTLHTNDAPGAVTRLIEMGIEPFLVGSAVDCVVAQRLARLLCEECKRRTTIKSEVMRANGFNVGLDLEAYEPVGCARCGGSGYKGRIGLYEVMWVSDTIRALAVAREPAETIAHAAVHEGMMRLREDGLEKVRRGLTSIAEIARVAGTR